MNRSCSNGVSHAQRNKSVKLLDVRIDALRLSGALEFMEQWILARDGKSRYVVCVNTHSIMEARHDPVMRAALAASELAVPDGLPVVWFTRTMGQRAERITGTDLFTAFCRLAEQKGYSAFFYGGHPDYLQRLVENCKRRFSNLKIVGAHAPPLGAEAVTTETIEMINRAKPDVLWVGLGCPKQERWLHQHRDQLRVPVMVGIGALFDYFSGRVPRAPRWMQRAGLEWLFRLVREPGRLWHRYLILGPQFVMLALWQVIHRRR